MALGSGEAFKRAFYEGFGVEGRLQEGFFSRPCFLCFKPGFGLFAAWGQPIIVFSGGIREWLQQLSEVPLSLVLSAVGGLAAFTAAYGFLGPAAFDSRRPPLGGWPKEAEGWRGWRLMERPVSVELAAPLKADWRPVDLCRAASLLAGSRPRAFELEWDGGRLRLYFTGD
ncbi:MAG: hypothetical protein QW341_00600, partial [Candidatus Bathyarchaeia archaeon]